MVLFFTILSFSAFAQAFYKGVHIMMVDGGFGGYYKQVIAANKNDELDNKMKTTKWLANSYGLHYEYGISEWRKKGALGIGLYLGMRKVDARSPDSRDPVAFREVWNRYYCLGGEVRYHFYTRDRWDPYFYGMVGGQWRIFKYAILNARTPQYPQTSKSKFVFAGQFSAGARYYPANNFAFFGEIGFGIYYAKLGVSLIIVP